MKEGDKNQPLPKATGSGPNEYQRALARSDIAQLFGDVARFVTTKSWQHCRTEADWDAFDRWMSADAEKMMSYVALVAERVSDLDCIANASIKHLDDLLHLADARAAEPEVQAIFERILNAARSDSKWKVMVQTAAWFTLGADKRAAVMSAAGIPEGLNRPD